MVTIHLGSINKKDNSTKQPTRSGVTFDGFYTTNGVLRTPSDMITPVITFNKTTEAGNVLLNFNYAYIEDFDRFYWIVNKVAEDNNHVTLYLQIDVLATYKNNINNTTCYVSRNANVYNGDYVDSAYSTSAKPSIIKNAISPYSPASNIANGVFIIGTVSEPTTTNSSGVTYWVVGFTPFAKLVKALGDSVSLARLMGYTVDSTTKICSGLTDSVKGLTADMVVSMYNPLQFVKSVVFYPLLPAYVAEFDPVQFKLGSITFTDVWALRLQDKSFFGTYGIPNTQTLSTRITATVPKHPQIANRGNYLAQPPYSQYHLSVAGFGEFDIDPAKLQNISTLYFKMVTDFRDGSAVLYVDSATDTWGTIAQIHGKCGTTWSLGQRAADMSVSGLMASTFGSAMNLLSTGADITEAISESITPAAPIAAATSDNWLDKLGAGILNVGNAIGNFFNNTVETASTIIKENKSGILDGVRMVSHMSFAGSTGTFAEFLADSFIQLIYYSVADTRDEDIGRPLNTEKLLSTLTGFTMCVNPHVINASTELGYKATKLEIDSINAALAAGVILE